MVNEINSAINEEAKAEIAIVYDKNGVYVSTDGGVKELRRNNEEVLYRDSIKNLDSYKFDSIKRQKIMAQATINAYSKNSKLLSTAYDTSASPFNKNKLSFLANDSRIPNVTLLAYPYFLYLNVDLRWQGGENNFCWAACEACVVNYVNGTDYTTADVADLINGGIDETRPADDVVEDLNNTFGLTDYTHITYYSISATKILNSLNYEEGYPVYGAFSSYLAGHACVIYGIHISNGTYSFMNPWTPSYVTSTWSGRDFTYIGVPNGVTYTLAGMIYKD